MYKNKNKNTRDKATQPTQATNAVSSPPCTNYEELDELQLERCYAGQCNKGTISRVVGGSTSSTEGGGASRPTG